MRAALARALAVLACALFVVLATPPAAHALCEGDPPAAKRPDSGMPGWFVSKVEVEVDPDGFDLGRFIEEQPDPFTDEGVRFVDTYGYGYGWGTYDLGCGPDAARDPAAIAFTGMANFTFDMGLTAGAVTQGIRELIFDSPLNFLNSTISTTQTAIFDRLWTVWFPITLLVVGIYIIVRSRKARFSEVTTSALFVMVILCASVYFLSWPLRALAVADQALSEGSRLATDAFTEEEIAEDLARNVYYPAWLRGTLGSDDSQAARAYGPDLFWSQHYTWAEVAAIEMIEDQAGDGLDDPVREILLGAIAQAKAERYAEIAAEIKDRHPDAYEYLRGKESADRIGIAAVQTVYSSSAAFFYVIAMAFLLMAFMIVRAFVIGFPLAGILGAYPPARPTLAKLWDLLTAALWNAVKFAFSAGLFAVITQAILNSAMNVWWQIFILIVLTVVLLLVLRPFRALKAMTPGLNENSSYLRSFLRHRDRRRRRDDDDDDPKDRRRRPSEEEPTKEKPRSATAAENAPMNPLPSPTTSQTRKQAAESLPAIEATHAEMEPQPIAAVEVGTGRPGTFTPPARPLGTDTPGSVTVLTGRNSTTDHTGSSDTATMPGHSQQSPASSTRHSGRAASSNDSSPSEPLYRRHEDTPAEPVDLVVADPVVDTATGQEVFVIYKRPRGKDS